MEIKRALTTVLSVTFGVFLGMSMHDAWPLRFMAFTAPSNESIALSVFTIAMLLIYVILKLDRYREANESLSFQVDRLTGELCIIEKKAKRKR